MAVVPPLTFSVLSAWPYATFIRDLVPIDLVASPLVLPSSVQMNQDIQANQSVLKSFTGRFYLTPPSASDDEAVAAILSHPTTRPYLQFIPEETSPEDACVRRESRAANQTIYDFNVYLKSDGEGKDKFAGMAGLIKADTVHKSCEMYMLVSPDLHRQGVALEAMHATLRYAFEELGMHRVAIGTAVDNLPMQGVLTAAKAPYEGCLRGAIVAGPGSWADIMLYGILETDWADAVRPCLEGRMKSSTESGDMIDEFPVTQSST